jgi:type II secretory pathway component GspD/PulD (secretin)
MQIMKKGGDMTKRELFFVLPFLLISFSAMQLCSQAKKTIVITGEDETIKTYKLLPLQSIEYETVNAVCRPWLSKGGVLVYEKKRNSVLVYDTPEVIAKIKNFISKTDSPAVNIRIEIQSIGGGPSNSDKVIYKTRKPTKIVYDKGKVYVKKPHDGKFDISSQRGYTSDNTSQFIVTQSGHPATLWVGKTMVDPAWLRVQKPGKSVIIGPNSTTVVTSPQEPVMTNVGVSLKVLPRYFDNDMIEVEIYPELSEVTGKGKNKAVKVTSLSSKITVKNGSRVPIGGVIRQKQQQYINIFGPDFFKSQGISDVMNMYLKASVMKPGSQSYNYDWIPR